MAEPSRKSVAQPMVLRACGHVQEFQHYTVDKYRAQRLAKFQKTLCPECLAKLAEEQQLASEAQSRVPGPTSALTGKWIAWDEEHETILASADTYPELMNIVEEQGLDSPDIDRAPGLLAGVAAKPQTAHPGNAADLLEEIKATLPNAEEWLDTPNARLWCEKPRDLIHTPKEEFVRSLLRGIRSGIMS